MSLCAYKSRMKGSKDEMSCPRRLKPIVKIKRKTQNTCVYTPDRFSLAYINRSLNLSPETICTSPPLVHGCCISWRNVVNTSAFPHSIKFDVPLDINDG